MANLMFLQKKIILAIMPLVMMKCSVVESSASRILEYAQVLEGQSKAGKLRGNSEEGSSTRHLIVDGQEVAEGQDPAWFAHFVSYKEEKFGTRISECGGVLISKDIVLTAAHCIVKEDGNAVPKIIKIGGHNSYWVDQDGEPEYTNKGDGFITEVEGYIVHEDFDRDADDDDFGRNDIALLKLASPVDHDNFPVWGEAEKDDFVRIMGHGNSDNLQEGNAHVRSENKCEDYHESYDEEKMLCYGKGAQATAEGDSGGPILIEPNDVLVGIHSFSNADNTNPSGVATRISYYTEWVLDTLCFLSTENKPFYHRCEQNILGQWYWDDADDLEAKDVICYLSPSINKKSCKEDCGWFSCDFEYDD